MKQHESIKLFEEKKVRTLWDEEQEKWYISVVDVVEILTDSQDFQRARKYWNKLKQRLKDEGNETVTNCHQLKMKAVDGKMRLTYVADTEQLFRLIQSIPSPKAEPFKLWLARVARKLRTGQKLKEDTKFCEVSDKIRLIADLTNNQFFTRQNDNRLNCLELNKYIHDKV